MVTKTQFVVFWVVTSYNIVAVYWRFGGQSCFHLQGEVFQPLFRNAKTTVFSWV